MGSTSETDTQYDQIVNICRDVFVRKMKDYGSAWRILRPSSLTDQIYIKAQRIRSLQRKGTQKIVEGIPPEFIGIVNYSLMGLIQLHLGPSDETDLDEQRAVELFDHYAGRSKELMQKKNHDYGEAWRDMRVTSLTDIILMKLLRIKQIENNEGKTTVSEGIDANYYDIVNYAVFALIRMELEGAK